MTRVCQRSQVRGDPWPSSSYPEAASNAESTDARAAVWIEATRSSSRRQSACRAAGTDATSAAASQLSASTAIRTASVTDVGSLLGAPGVWVTLDWPAAASEGRPGCWPGPHTGTTSHFAARQPGPESSKVMIKPILTRHRRCMRYQCRTDHRRTLKKMEGHSTENDLPNQGVHLPVEPNLYADLGDAISLSTSN